MTSFWLIQIAHSVANMRFHSAALRYRPSPMDARNLPTTSTSDGRHQPIARLPGRWGITQKDVHNSPNSLHTIRSPLQIQGPCVVEKISSSIAVGEGARQRSESSTECGFSTPDARDARIAGLPEPLVLGVEDKLLEH